TEKTIEITGRLVGEDQDERTMRFYAGVSDNGSLGPDFKSVIVSAQETVAIERPSLGLSATFNGESAPIYIAPAGREVSTTVRYQNNLPERIINPRLELIFSGGAFDEESVRVYNDGEFSESSNRITWEIRNVNGNRELLPGQSGAVSLSFSSL